MSLKKFDDNPERARLYDDQKLLFPKTPRQVCEDIELNWWSAVTLHQSGWLSFDPETVETLHERQELELRFIGSLVTGGCSPLGVAELLRTLKHPYCYDGRKIYYDFQEKRWRLLPVPPEPDIVFSDWLEDLVSGGEIDRLKLIQGEVEKALRKCKAV